MTIEQLKEMLSTYGVNDEERNAPVFVNINGVPTPITVEGSLADYGSHPDDPAQGPFVLLQAGAGMSDRVCRICGELDGPEYYDNHARCDDIIRLASRPFRVEAGVSYGDAEAHRIEWARERVGSN